MSAFGYMGKILHVDLSSEQFEIKKLELDAARDYLGGLGLNVWLKDSVAKKCFELFRNQMSNVSIITFDELFEKASLLINTLEQAPEEYDDIPF